MAALGAVDLAPGTRLGQMQYKNEYSFFYILTTLLL